jgi:hypothetical protein
MLTPIVHLMILHFKQSLKSANFLNKKNMEIEWSDAEQKTAKLLFMGFLMITLLLFRLLPYTKLHLMKNGFKTKDLNDYAVTHFFDSKSAGMFFYTHNKHSNLIARKMEVSDVIFVQFWNGQKFILF